MKIQALEPPLLVILVFLILLKLHIHNLNNTISHRDSTPVTGGTTSSIPKAVGPTMGMLENLTQIA